MMATAEHGPDLIAREQLLELTDQLGPASCREFISNLDRKSTRLNSSHWE